MKNFSAASLRALRALPIVALAVSGAASNARSFALRADCTPQLSMQRQRLYEKSGEGPDALRDSMFIRRGILQLAIYETGVWADSVRAARARCLKELARANVTPGTTRIATSRNGAAMR